MVLSVRGPFIGTASRTMQVTQVVVVRELDAGVVDWWRTDDPLG